MQKEDFNGNRRVELQDLDLVLIDEGDDYQTLQESWIFQRPIGNAFVARPGIDI